jgi:hypothetical protein
VVLRARVGARLEQKRDGRRVVLRRRVVQRRVAVRRRAARADGEERRVAAEETAQRVDVAALGGGEPLVVRGAHSRTCG